VKQEVILEMKIVLTLEIQMMMILMGQEVQMVVMKMIMTLQE